MSTTETPAKLHSAEFFGEQRDFWWNRDYVALLAQRFQLDRVRMALDVGCGVGHWSRVILPHLPPEARLFGIDREETWVKEAAARAEKAGIGDRTSYRLGEAERIPFHDDTFDLVTCQTVLIHVRDPKAVIREMMRVTKPGGLVLMMEPNNMAGVLVLGATLFRAPLDGILDYVRLYLTCTRGKENLGEGNDSIGELIPGYAAEVGLTDIQLYLNDRPSPLIPPYADRAQAVLRDQILEWDEKDFWLWGHDTTRRYFLAGGGGEADFERLWQAGFAGGRAIAAAVRAGTEHSAGGTVGYVIGGRKPA
ncbi:MAG: methyltransferase domain-containing protein [Minicystis sp.]